MHTQIPDANIFQSLHFSGSRGFLSYIPSANRPQSELRALSWLYKYISYSSLYFARGFIALHVNFLNTWKA